MIKIHPEASAEVREAWLWYGERDPDLADAFQFELDRAIDQIDRAPLRWPPHQLGTRRYLMHRFPYDVIYRVSDTSVIVYAVAHQRRRPGYWKNRLN